MSLKEFVKIAVGLREHPKVLQAGDAGGWMYVCAIMWSKEHDTDGFIPEYAVARLTGLKQPKRVLRRLLDANLFEVAENGFRIHDYLEIQESSSRRKAAAKKAAEARWGAKDDMRSASDSDANGNADAMRDRNAEEEEEEEEEKEEEEEIPPSPPMGGRERDRLRYGLEFNSWVAEHFPGVQPAHVEHCVGVLRGRNRVPTVAELRPLIETGKVRPREAA